MNSYKFSFKIDLPDIKLSGELHGRSRYEKTAGRSVQASIQSTLKIWGIVIEREDISITLIEEEISMEEKVEIKSNIIYSDNPFRNKSKYNKTFELLLFGTTKVILLVLFNKQRIEPLIEFLNKEFKKHGFKIIQSNYKYYVKYNKEENDDN